MPEWERSGPLQIGLVETIGYVIAWSAFPLIMLGVTRWIDRARRFVDFMVPYNWSQVRALCTDRPRNRERGAGSSGRRGHRVGRLGRGPRLRMVHRAGRARCHGSGGGARRL